MAPMAVRKQEASRLVQEKPDLSLPLEVKRGEGGRKRTRPDQTRQMRYHYDIGRATRPTYLRTDLPSNLPTYVGSWHGRPSKDGMTVLLTDMASLVVVREAVVVVPTAAATRRYGDPGQS